MLDQMQASIKKKLVTIAMPLHSTLVANEEVALKCFDPTSNTMPPSMCATNTRSGLQRPCVVVVALHFPDQQDPRRNRVSILFRVLPESKAMSDMIIFADEKSSRGKY